MIRKKYKKLDYSTEDLESLTPSDLKKVADYSLRQFLLRKADRRNGKIFCPIKCQWFTEDKIHVAHYIDRGFSMWTRYSLKNCHLISEQSNSWEAQIMIEGFKSKHHKEYQEFLIEKYGDDILNELKELSEKRELFTKEDYIETIKKFRNE